MKKLCFTLLLPVLWSCLSGSAQEPTFEEHLSKTFSGEGLHAVGVYNMNGSIHAEGYNGADIRMEIEKKITSESTNGLEQGKTEFKLNFETIEGKLNVFIEEPWNTAPRSIRPENSYYKNRKEPPYQVHLQFTLKVPNHLILDLATVNKGDVMIKNFSGEVSAGNVNGGISITDASEVKKAVTVNGPITIDFVKNPSIQSEIKTINGKISLSYPPDLSGEFSMKTLNGEYFTNFDYTPSTEGVSQKFQEKNGVKQYKISQKTLIRIGDGGVRHSTETLNGNIYIKKNI